MKRGIYVMKFERVNYDEYEGFVVIANNRKRVMEIIKSGHDMCLPSTKKENIGITKVGESNLKEQIVFDSFCAG